MNHLPASQRFPGLKLLVAIASFMVVVAGIMSAQTFLVPILFSLFLAVLGTPAVGMLMRMKFPKIIAVLTVALIFIAILVGVGTLLGRSVNEFTTSMPKYTERVNELSHGFQVWLKEQGIPTLENGFFASIKPDSVMDLVGTALRGLVSALSSTMMVFIVMGFMLFEAADFRDKLRFAMGEAFNQERFEGVAHDVQRYLAIKTATSAITGFLVGAFNFGMGIDFWLLWGIIAYIMNYIPFVGSILASFPAIILALVQFGFPAAITVAIVYLIINVGVSNFLEPIMMGRRLGLSPLVVFLSLVIWGWIWGPAGMLLSVPLTMVFKILLEHSEEFRWIAILMDNRPENVPDVTA
ncbi:MAG: AI-2E family transporter [Bdellovibrionales bacterium]|nr:AI-2E family transporter [Bdellovibrionales bacterium]